jgi:hypothetical protein
LGGDFNAHTAILPDTTNINDLCELLQMHELIETKQINTMVKR